MECKRFNPIKFMSQLQIALIAASLVSLARANEPSVEVIMGLQTTLQRAVTINLGWPGPQTAVPVPPVPPTVIAPDTRVHFTAPDFGFSDPVVEWFKDGNPLGITSPTLTIERAASEHMGTYFAWVSERADERTRRATASIAILVRRDSQRLTNTSTRVTLSPGHPAVIHGFVVERGPASAALLIRAVGPTLKTLGVEDALNAPKLEVFDAAGNRQVPWPWTGISPEDAAKKAGAFPLPPGSNDVAGVYDLSSGAYTIHVSAADGGSGTVLVEIYEL